MANDFRTLIEKMDFYRIK